MEYIDILNENGVRTGEVLPRDETHKKGLWHRAVIAAIINSDNQILMQQRSETKNKYCNYFPGLWDISVAGHVVSGEDAVTTLVRELNEEIGLMVSEQIKVKDFRFVSSFKNIHHWEDKKFGLVYEHAFYEFFIINMDLNISDLKFNDGEVMNVKWLSLSEIKKLKSENKLHPRSEWIDEVTKYLSI